MNSSMTLCPACEVEALVVRERREVPLGQRRVVIDDERMRCRECDEEFYTTEQADRRHRLALDQARLEDGLLSPREIKSIRESLSLTQRQFELLLGVGEKTVVRWEAGRVCPNKGIDRLIRLVAANKHNVQLLAAINGVVLEADPPDATAPVSFDLSPSAWQPLYSINQYIVEGTAEVPSVDREEEISAVQGALEPLSTKLWLRPEQFFTSRPSRTAS